MHRSCCVSAPRRCLFSRAVPLGGAASPGRPAPQGPRSGRCAPLRAAEDDAVALGDWREFRARLVKQQSAEPATARQCEDNVRLLEMQDPALAAEGVWAHATPGPERGGLLLATNEAPELLKDDKWWQTVILLVEHGPQGSLGLILNRPTGMVLGRKTQQRRDGLPFAVENVSGDLQDVFGSNRIYCGGFTAQHMVHLLHGQVLPRAVEVVPGVFMGGDAGASDAVSKGLATPEQFKFFAGAVVWDEGQLQMEVDMGVWNTAACSRSLVLKQCLQLPIPLWQEVLRLLGGKYLEVAREGYEGDE